MPRERIKEDVSEVNDVASRLVRADALTFFAEHCETALVDWISILGKTSLPDGITSSDPRVVAAFEELDSIIDGRESTPILQRLAYMQLLRVFETLKQIINSDHRDGKIELRSGLWGFECRCRYIRERSRAANTKEPARRTHSVC